MINLYSEGAYLLNGNDLIFNSKESNECIKAKLGEKYLNNELNSNMMDILDKLDPVTTTDELIPSGDTSSYRSNLINWGILPLLMDGEPEFKCGDFIYLTDVVNSIRERKPEIKGYIVGDEMKEISLSVGQLTDNEIEILLSGCLINFNKNKMINN
ncbi:hypothetical protein [Clostridium sp. JS66]|uniref:hypothetical protein n=1 Tax=Clostridium sp. JS66 TaxID=3064705 RepID=UPI00298E2C9C|nr:hypothetical protein [Clostridium sp. JS66]WPC41251.1 hypothetical protein Q6H37_25690 [Clostridium sp. JS66]